MLARLITPYGAGGQLKLCSTFTSFLLLRATFQLTIVCLYLEPFKSYEASQLKVLYSKKDITGSLIQCAREWGRRGVSKRDGRVEGRGDVG